MAPVDDPAARWFALFRAFGEAPSPDSYAAVFHPEGEVADAGMPAPTPASQVREAIAHVLRLMPDLHIDMQRYRSRGDAVFVEAANRGTVNGTPVAWNAVYRVHLRDGLVHRGRRFYDQARVFRALRPDLGWLPPPAAAAGEGPRSYAELVPGAPVTAAFAPDTTIEVADQPAPIPRAALASHLGGAPFAVVDHAGDDMLAFVEWRRGALSGIDRLELSEGRIVALRRYFDTLGLLAEYDPTVLELRAALLSNAGR